MFLECERQYSLGDLIQAFSTEDKETSEILEFIVQYKSPGILLEPGCNLTIHDKKYCLKSVDKTMDESKTLILEIKYIFIPV